MQAEERAEDKGEPGSIEEESRKKKRRIEKTKTEKRAEKARSLILDKANALMERSLKDRGFIVERRFNSLLSPFVEMIEK